MPPITRQGNIGSCTAHALAAALEHDQIQQGRSSSTHYPSLLQLYYSEREIRGSINEDVGAQLADGIRVLYETGTCSEALWPYSDDTLLYKVKPSDACFAEAARNRDQQGIAHSRVAPNIESIKHVHNRGYSVLLGIQVYKDFDSSEFAQSALAKLPAPDETSTGGHALLSVGYDDREFLTTSWGETRANPHYRHLIVRNSWGNAWGDKGYFYLPYDYVNPSRVYEVWVVRKTT